MPHGRLGTDRCAVAWDYVRAAAWSAGGIVEYLLEKYSQGDLTVPHGTVARAEYLQVRPSPG